MRLTALFLAALALVASADPVFYEKRYEGFTVWLDCRQHGAVAFHYELGADTGDVPRDIGSFGTDPAVPGSCQPTSGRSYRTTTVDPETGTWDRGHLVPANHMDGSERSVKDTFFVTNILPQQSAFNQRGAWRLTEDIIECYRDIATLSVWGGVVWGEDATNDFFTETHGLVTPDYWWKVIHRHDTGDYLAYLFPNHRTATADDIDEYLLSLADLKDALEVVPDFGDLEDTDVARQAPDQSWEVEKVGSSQLRCEGQTTDAG